MPTKEIEEFARALVELVRDRSISNCDGILAPHARGPTTKRWRRLAATPEALREVIADVVDDTIFCLLNAIDNGDLPLRFVDKSGREVDLMGAGEGEMAGWYVGAESWREQYSQERFYDDNPKGPDDESQP